MVLGYLKSEREKNPLKLLKLKKIGKSIINYVFSLSPLTNQHGIT